MQNSAGFRKNVKRRTRKCMYLLLVCTAHTHRVQSKRFLIKEQKPAEIDQFIFDLFAFMPGAEYYALRNIQSVTKQVYSRSYILYLHLFSFFLTIIEFRIFSDLKLNSE